MALIIGACLCPPDLLAKKRGGSITDSGNEASGQWYHKSVALVVGIDEYRHGWPPLCAAVSDAKLVAKELESQGFEVIRLLNNQATKARITRYLYDVIPGKVGPGDRLIIYFSGHGQTETAPGGQLGYLVPYDGCMSKRKDLFSSYISMKEVKSILMDKYKVKHILLVSDVCFSGLMTGRGSAKNAEIDTALRLSGSMVLTAGGKNEPAEDGLFTSVFLDGIRGGADYNGDHYVTFSELAQHTRRDVLDKSGGRQRPLYGWWLGEGEIVFASKSTNPSTQKTASPPIASPSEVATTMSSEVAAAMSPEVKTAGEITGIYPNAQSRNPRYQLTGCGTILDKNNRLEWLVGPDRDMDYNQAAAWAQKLGFCGGRWRLPTLKELETLYLNGAGKANRDMIFNVDYQKVWSSQKDNPGIAHYFYFYRGFSQWQVRTDAKDMRVLAVRRHAASQ